MNEQKRGAARIGSVVFSVVAAVAAALLPTEARAEGGKIVYTGTVGDQHRVIILVVVKGPAPADRVYMVSSGSIQVGDEVWSVSQSGVLGGLRPQGGKDDAFTVTPPSGKLLTGVLDNEKDLGTAQTVTGAIVDGNVRKAFTVTISKDGSL